MDKVRSQLTKTRGGGWGEKSFNNFKKKGKRGNGGCERRKKRGQTLNLHPKGEVKSQGTGEGKDLSPHHLVKGEKGKTVSGNGNGGNGGPTDAARHGSGGMVVCGVSKNTVLREEVAGCVGAKKSEKKWEGQGDRGQRSQGA